MISFTVSMKMQLQSSRSLSLLIFSLTFSSGSCEYQSRDYKVYDFKTFEETFLNVARDIIQEEGVTYTYNETHWQTDRPISPTDKFRLSFLVQQLVHMLHRNKTHLELILPPSASVGLPLGTSFERLRLDNFSSLLYFLKVKTLRRLGQHGLDIEAKWTIPDFRVYVTVGSGDPQRLVPYMFFVPEPVSMILNLVTHIVANATAVDVKLSRTQELLAIPLNGTVHQTVCGTRLPLRDSASYVMIYDMLETFLERQFTCLLHGVKTED